MKLAGDDVVAHVTLIASGAVDLEADRAFSSTAAIEAQMDAALPLRAVEAVSVSPKSLHFKGFSTVRDCSIVLLLI